VLTYLARRIATAAGMLLVIASLAFALVQLMPGDPAVAVLGESATDEAVAQLRTQMGLDKPVGVRFVEFLGGLATGDLGTSLATGTPVAERVLQRLPVTLSIAIGGTVLCLIVGISVGTLAAVRGGMVDATVRVLTGVGLAVPNFWIGVLLVLTIAVTLRALPAGGYVPINVDPGGWMASMTLPLTAVALGSSASIARQTRVAMLDTLQRDYVQTLRAAGLPEWRVVLRHGLRNASIPVVTAIGLQFVSVLGGAVVVEQVFSLPGVGQLTLEAVSRSDFPVLLGVVVYASALILLMNIALDVVYAMLNPKVRPT
jgi:peptide/nickel transport system permease protein